MINRNAGSQWEINENKEATFSIQVRNALDSIQNPRGPRQIQAFIQQVWGGQAVRMWGGGECVGVSGGGSGDMGGIDCE